MLKDANFLCEIGTEEIPAGYMPPAIDSINKIFTENLNNNRIDFNEIEVLATPRRIAVLVSGLADSQRAEEVEVRGPSAKAAYDSDGNPTKALEGFLKGNDISAEDVYTKDLGKGDYVFANRKLESRKTGEIIPAIIEQIIGTLPFPKRMKWSNKKLTFPRPIAYFLILFNDRVVPFEIEGIFSSNKTRGHYIQHNMMIPVEKISDYEKILSENGIILDQNKRKKEIEKQLHETAQKAGGSLNEDEDLLDTVTFLVEDPHVVLCEFDKDFLEIPDAALIAEMKEHQKYFAVMNPEGGLTNYFLVTSNNPVTDNIMKGNVRVISARFNDARFFYDEDRKVKLFDRVDSLKKVLFHKELGSIFDKVQRMQSVAGKLVQKLSLDNETDEKVQRAVLLSKTDLNTAMVIEFSSLQGKIGRIYAQMDGEDSLVAAAIEEHYRPRFHGDILPENMISVIVSLSEKIDNIFGSFSVGNIPKGSQDPYALRRQANAVVELLLSKEINLSLRELLFDVAGNYKNGSDFVDKIVDFISARAKTIFQDRELKYDEIDACLSTGNTDYLELMRRADSINSFRKNENFSEMLLGFKRMNNIVSAFRRENGDYELKFNAALLEEKEEKDLFDFFNSRKEIFSGFIADSKYIELFEQLIKGKSIIDSFFDKVLVMDKRTDLRDNRLNLLENILSNFTGLLDFSKISDK